MKTDNLPSSWRIAVVLPILVMVLSACGGGGDSEPAPESPPVSTPPTNVTPTEAERTAAATATAQNDTNPCAPIRPFYWEVGDASQRKASGATQAGANTAAYDSATLMNIASASKWLYGSYVVQRRNALLNDSDIQFLNFRSGYTNFSICLQGQTVDGCLGYRNNGVHSDATDGKFYYDGGHMQKHASLLGLGPLNNAGLAAEVQSQLGSDIDIRYNQPQLAGGVVSNADNYARFLRKLLTGDLQMKSVLGTHAVCTNPSTCGTDQALATPVPLSESWHYSIGHWVEDDPLVGDGAFSSPGAFGFYPWIDASKTWYGVIARMDTAEGSGMASAQCGRLIRKAWITGTAS